MNPDSSSARVLAFVNIAHALDHFVLLIFPTAVIVIAAERGLAYSDLIGLSTGAFVAFGLFSLPVGWLADRVGRRAMLAAFFFGYGATCLGLATASTPTSFMLWLLALGVASAIYHPVGSALLVTHARRLGRDLGRNAVWGNLGAASASGVTALIASQLGWRAGFVAPGLLCIAVGIAFLALVPGGGVDQPGGRGAAGHMQTGSVSRPLAIGLLLALAVMAGGMTFNMATIAMPKLIDERLGLPLPLALTGSLVTAVFAFGAVTQFTVGRLVDRVALPRVFVALTMMQPLGLALAALTTGVPMLLGLVAVMAAVYGQVVVNDAMIARYVPPVYRAKAFGLRYFLGFTASGFAVPLIAALHARGGFPLVLGVAAAFGVLILAAAIGFALAARPTAGDLAPAD